MIKYLGFNLLSEDCESSATHYNKVFKFTIIKSSKNHSELMVSKKNILYFNKPSLECPVSPGSFTLRIKKLNIKKLQSHLSFCELESHSEANKYASFLDPYKNRIWFYES